MSFVTATQVDPRTIEGSNLRTNRRSRIGSPREWQSVDAEGEISQRLHRIEYILRIEGETRMDVVTARLSAAAGLRGPSDLRVEYRAGREGRPEVNATPSPSDVEWWNPMGLPATIDDWPGTES